MPSEKNQFVRLCCFIALLLAAVLILINNVLPLIKVDIGGKAIDVLVLIKDISLLLGIAFGAFSFARQRKWLLVVFWIALIVYIASAICGLF